jgi:imidazole glycerol phosphate synthase subunit HisF
VTIRVIARLDIKGSDLVKGIPLEGLRVFGKPEEFARYYYEQGADELLYMELCDEFRSPHLWTHKSGGCKLRHTVS